MVLSPGTCAFSYCSPRSSPTSSERAFFDKAAPLVNGFEKKALLLDVVEALCANPRVELEGNLPSILHCLLRGATAPELSVTASDFETAFREKCALLLARLAQKSIQ